MAGELTALSLCVWSTSVLLCLLMSLHTFYVLPLHLYYRFVLEVRTSKVWSEVFRFSFAVTSLSYSVFKLAVVEPDGRGELMNSLRSCTVVTYGTSTLFGLSLWSLIGFFTTKVTIAQKLRKMLGFPRLRWVKTMFLVCHMICAGLLITYLVTLHPHFRGSNYGADDCRSSAGKFSVILEALVLLVQASLVSLFVHSMRLVYIGQRDMFGPGFADITVHSNERQILDEMREVVRVNAVWCSWSILGMTVMLSSHMLFWKLLGGSPLYYNLYVLIMVAFLSLNNLVLARVQSWRELYGYWLAYYSEEYRLVRCLLNTLDVCCFDCLCCCVSWMEQLLSISEEPFDEDTTPSSSHIGGSHSVRNMLIMSRSNRSLQGGQTTTVIGANNSSVMTRGGFSSRMSAFKSGRRTSQSWFRPMKRTSIMLDNQDMHIHLLSDDSVECGVEKDPLIRHHHRSLPSIFQAASNHGDGSSAFASRRVKGAGSVALMTGLTREHTASLVIDSESDDDDSGENGPRMMDGPSSAPSLADHRSLTQIHEPFDLIGRSFIRRISDS